MNAPHATQFELTDKTVVIDLDTLQRAIVSALATGPKCLSRIASAVSAPLAPSLVSAALEPMIEVGLVRARPAIVRCQRVEPFTNHEATVLVRAALAGNCITSDDIVSAIPQLDRQIILIALAEMLNAGEAEAFPYKLQTRPARGLVMGYRLKEAP